MPDWRIDIKILSMKTIALLFLLCTTLASQVLAEDVDQGSQITTVFKTGDEYGYRIPALTVSQKGTLLAFCERRVGLHDHAQNDIVLRRSYDGGKSWKPLQVIVDEGGDSLNDPCVVVIKSGRILLRYTRFPKGVHARISKHTVMAEPGYGGPKNVRNYLIHSDNDGETWSKPREVTRQMRRKNAIAIGSPGIAIQLTRGKHAGRIVYPNYEFYSLGGGRASTANSVSYSDDGGETWQLSGVINDGDWTGRGNEAQVVELKDGSILLSARNQKGKDPYRRISVSRNSGKNWSTQRMAKDLMTPACMSSVIRYRWSDGNKPGVLLHSLPNTKKSRMNGTIFSSQDEGTSWQKLRVIEPDGFAYSCLTKLPNGDIGCLYETTKYKSILFVRFKYSWLMKTD